MNHPGIFISLLWLLMLAVSPGLLEWKNQQSDVAQEGYVCPPCGCPGHDRIYQLPGSCQTCGMPLIQKNYPKVSWIEWVFRSEDRFAMFHHKLFYPAYFLAIFIGLVSVRKYKKDPQTVFFLIFFLSHVLYAFKSQLGGTGHSMRASERWFFFPVSFLLAAGPALYFYVRQYGEKNLQFSGRDKFHFLPALLVVFLNLLFFVGPQAWRDAVRYNGFDHYPGLVEQQLFPISGMVYIIYSLKCYRRKNLIEADSKRWLSLALAAQSFFILLWMVMILSNFFLYNWMSTSLDYHWIWTLVACFSLVGAYLIIFQRDLVFPKSLVKDNRLSGAQLEVLKDRLYRVMQEERVYLDPDLSLKSLAQRLDIREKELSELLNSGLQTSFYNFVNQYRLEEVKQQLLNPSRQHLTNYAIAQEAGFSSKSTFFKLFKKHAGMTPGAYKKRFQT